MLFRKIDFLSKGFALTREDDIQIFFPYNKFEYLTIDHSLGTMRIEIKKYGAFTRHYSNVDQMLKDADLLLGKGKAHDRN